jgi:hypothetical protein
MIGFRGMGALTPPPLPNYVNCPYPFTPECVAGNAALNTQYEAAMAAFQVANNDAQCVSNANQNPEPFRSQMLAACGGSYSPGGAGFDAANSIPYTPPPTASGPSPSGGRVNFTTSRGTNAAQVGDAWQVAITGAAPNSPVTVSGTMPGSSFAGTAMGTTDSNGNFSKSGTFGTGDMGSWSEQWSVGGLGSGGFSFSVAPVVQLAPPTTTNGGGTATVPPPAGTLPASTSTTPAFSISSIPWWGWLAGGGVVLLAVKGGR